MTKIIGFKNRLMGLLFVAYYIIIVLLRIILGVIVSPVLFILGAGLIPLEIILFLIIGETKVFTVLYELGLKFWDVNIFSGKVELDLFDLVNND